MKEERLQCYEDIACVSGGDTGKGASEFMPHRNIFRETLTDRQSWEKCVNSRKTFMPLLKYIYETNHMKFDNGFIKLGVSGNSVYRVGGTVVKIFHPPEIKLLDMDRCETEITARTFCRSKGILTPDIVCTGTVYDTLYSFPYLVMNYVDGTDANKAVAGYDKSKKADYALRVKEIAKIMHVPSGINMPRYDDPNRINHELWNIMPESFRKDRKCYIENAKFPEPVFAHGDFCGRNMIIDKQGRLVLIDFAESMSAPYYYDEGDFDGDAVLLEAYYGDYQNDEFYDKLLMVRLLGWFGAVLTKWNAEEMGIDYRSITNVKLLRNMIRKRLDNQHT